MRGMIIPVIVGQAMDALPLVSNRPWNDIDSTSI
jgi:hypothetical protein